MPEATVLTGGCLCRRVRYRAGPPLYTVSVCHCESCRRGIGAHAVAWLTVSRASLQFADELPAQYASSAGIFRAHCAACGTAISYYTAARPDEIYLTVGSLDDPGRLAPADHIWMADALPWDRPQDGLPQHPGTRPLP